MSQKIIEGNGIVSSTNVDCEKDLRPQPGININSPPPWEEICDCCLRNISELKPFGGPGDPLAGDFTGRYFVKKYRPAGPYDEKYERLFKEAESRCEEEGFTDVFKYLKNKYGEEEGENIFIWAEFFYSVGSSWECRDCFVLDDDEYFKKKYRNADENISDNLNAGNRAD
jgi:hypothetical protein